MAPASGSTATTRPARGRCRRVNIACRASGWLGSRLVSQHPLEDLAGRTLRQTADELELAWDLVGRQMLTAVGLQLVRSDGLTVLQDDGRHRHLALDRVRCPVDRAFLYSG